MCSVSHIDRSALDTVRVWTALSCWPGRCVEEDTRARGQICVYLAPIIMNHSLLKEERQSTAGRLPINTCYMNIVMSLPHQTYSDTSKPRSDMLTVTALVENTFFQNANVALNACVLNCHSKTIHSINVIAVYRKAKWHTVVGAWASLAVPPQSDFIRGQKRHMLL